VIVNRGETEQDAMADVRLDAAAGVTMTKILERIKA